MNVHNDHALVVCFAVQVTSAEKPTRLRTILGLTKSSSAIETYINYCDLLKACVKKVKMRDFIDHPKQQNANTQQRKQIETCISWSTESSRLVSYIVGTLHYQANRTVIAA